MGTWTGEWGVSSQRFVEKIQTRPVRAFFASNLLQLWGIYGEQWKHVYWQKDSNDRKYCRLDILRLFHRNLQKGSWLARQSLQLRLFFTSILDFRFLIRFSNLLSRVCVRVWVRRPPISRETKRKFNLPHLADLDRYEDGIRLQCFAKELKKTKRGRAWLC